MLIMKSRLLDHESNLERGAILRCKGFPPYEEYVDFMIVESLTDDGMRYALLVVSGYKAGLTYVLFPKESLPLNEDGTAIDVKWLRNNWKKWGYIDCDLGDVYIFYPHVPRKIALRSDHD
jgi:hypothetical protein